MSSWLGGAAGLYLVTFILVDWRAPSRAFEFSNTKF
jgi:hypothetical protein